MTPAYLADVLDYYTHLTTAEVEAIRLALELASAALAFEDDWRTGTGRAYWRLNLQVQEAVAALTPEARALLTPTPNPGTVTSGLLNRFSGTQGAGSAPVDPEPLEGPQNGTETGGGLA